VHVQRRELLKAGLSLPFLGPWAALAAQGATTARTAGFTPATVVELARKLAASAYRPADTRLPPALQVGYDQYRDIRFNPAQAVWREQDLPFQLQMFHRGFLFPHRVELNLVQDGRASPLVYSPRQFDFQNQPVPAEADLGFAGFRIHHPLNRAEYFDELCTFLGASYFRAVPRGLNYGLSARGLALGSGDAGAEEFPLFTRFWIEQPAAGADQIVVHALMDSPSVAGAFRFVIRPGAETVFDVQTRLFPRVTLHRAGIAPLTSMFQFDAGDRVGVDDYRSAVHDSDGLAMLNGRGEQLWRALRNPPGLQVSGFQDSHPRGFGLMQRKRDFSAYADLEAHYERRPSLWVEPRGDWGAGEVTLVEIPTADEYHDNIVAFWRPAAPLQAGREYRFDYRLHWCAEHSWQPELATVAMTRIGAAPAPGTRLVVIELAGGRLSKLAADHAVQADVWASGGRIANAVAYANAQTGGWRLSFEFTPEGSGDTELHARASDARGALSETWLYRWSA
jgi:glucans biosynthesis protein